VRQGDNHRWNGHPLVARMLRIVVALSPAIASWLVIRLVAGALPHPSDLTARIAWWVLIAAVGTLTLAVVDITARRLLPLSALLRLSLVFPDRAPSRYAVALRTGTVRQLEQRIARARAHGLSDDPTEAAEELIELVAALNAHDRITRGHAERVRAYTRLLGEELGLGGDDLDKLQWAGLLHDVGKIAVPAEILNKPGKPTADEWEVLKTHPAEGAKLAESLRPWLGDWVDAVGQHHERWDGAGYPNGRAGTDIALAARIVSVADTFDVITAARSYKQPQPAVEARAELARCAGSQFDPHVVRAFLGVSLGRLRLVMGPLAWVTQLPALARIPLAPAVGAGVSALATAAAVVLGGLGAPPPPAAEAVAAVTGPGPAPSARPVASTPAPTTITTTPPSPASTPATTTTTTTGAEPEPPVTVTTTPDAGAAAPEVPAPDAPPVPPEPPVEPPALEALADLTTTDEDVAVVVDPLANDVVEAGVAELTAGGADGGTVAVVDDAITYTPALDWSGTDEVTYTVVDGTGASATATITVVVTPVNDAPVAVGDSASTPEDTAVVVDVLGGDTDVDGDALAVASVGAGANGLATVGVGGLVTYTPTEGWSGTDSFTYVVADGAGGTDTATVTVTVAPVNDAPTAGDDAYAGAEGAPIVGNVLDNDSDEDGDVLTVFAWGGPAGGSLTGAPDGTFTYTPAAGFSGTVTVTYDVTDGTVSASASVTLTIDSGLRPMGLYLAPGAAGASAWWFSATAPGATGAEADHDADGDPGATIRSSNGDAGQADPRKYKSWVVQPSAPLALSGPVALDLWSTPKDFNPSKDGHLFAYLYDCAAGGSGCVELLSFDEHIKAWNGGVSGWVQHRFTLGSLDHTVAVGRELRLELLNAHSDLWVAMSGDRPSMLDLTLANTAPVANDDDGGTVLLGGHVDVDVLANDVDVDLDPGSVTIVSAPAVGTATVNPDGTIRYDAPLIGLSVVTFTYRVADTSGLTAEATVTVTVI
jgi:hypothetical protein